MDQYFISCIKLWVVTNVSLRSNPGRPSASNCLYYLRFLGHLYELDNDISSLQNFLLLSPRSDPWRALHVYELGQAKCDRYQLSRQQHDLDQSILHFAEAVYLPHPWDSCPIIIVQFYSLTLAIFFRAKAYGQHSDVRCCITYLRYLRAHWLQDTIDPHIPVTETLVSALAVKVELDLGEVDQDIDEMADLCRELLSSQTTISSRTRHITEFAVAVGGHIQNLFGGRVPSEKVLDCLRKAVIRFPDLNDVSIALAKSLLVRFNLTPSEDDYKEGMAMLDNVINFPSWGDSTTPFLEMALSFAALFAKVHFDAFGKPEHLEEAIYRLRTALERISPQDSNRSSMMANLSYLEGFRFDSSSITATAREVAEARSTSSDLAKSSSFKNLAASFHELDDTSIPEETRFRKHFDALELTSILRLTDIADIEDGVEYCRQLITSHPHSPLAPIAFVSLINLFRRAFQRTNQIEYLNQAISAARLCMNIIPSQRSRGNSLGSLISLLTTRLKLLHRREDLNELMQAFAQAAELERLGPFRRHPLSSTWATFARHFGHPSALTAYDRAMSSMEDTLTFSPTLDTQHFRLAAQLLTQSKALPFDYTSYLIHTGRLKQAIEILERGRALLWSQIRGLRTSVDGIRLADSNLADKFVAVNRDLENITFTSSPIPNVDGGDSGVNGMDPYRHLVVQQQKLLDDRENLISQIQTLPGFESFLKPPSFDTLCSATSHGPVIVINHSEWRSDIIILLHNSPPSLISTSDDFYARTKSLQDQLLGARKKGLESVKYEDTLRSVLKELYELVGRPVIKRLNELNVPEQSRVWWCPTSVFCSLPLHAMGPIPSDGNSQRYFLDLYISSYIPSLEALIVSRKASSQVINKPSILLVAQPDENMPKALKEMRVVQVAGTNVTTLFSSKATPAAVLASLRDHSFAHIVSHGKLEPGKPFEASFKLHRGKRLRLLDIARSQLPNAEFAFLSACHTAELTDESIADEVLHLAAATQFCGFRSVVGTMWAMADTDGRDLARWFYESVFSCGTQGERFYERTAVSLRDAVLKLRRKGGISLERWVNFVHYGA